MHIMKPQTSNDKIQDDRISNAIKNRKEKNTEIKKEFRK